LGDPPGFRLDECSTQRNLSEEGRAQARRVGAAFAARGIPIGRVLSSQWCRCLETARLAFGGAAPWPALNSFFRDRTQEAERTRGGRVLGCYDGFKWLVEGDIEHVTELTINELSRIHFDGGSIIRTSRTNPARTPDGPGRVAETLKRLGVDYLITIGGDDTAFAVSRVARALPGLAVAHVPKTIDNDLPLPSDIVTFGFTT